MSFFFFLAIATTCLILCDAVAVDELPLFLIDLPFDVIFGGGGDEWCDDDVEDDSCSGSDGGGEGSLGGVPLGIGGSFEDECGGVLISWSVSKNSSSCFSSLNNLSVSSLAFFFSSSSLYT